MEFRRSGQRDDRRRRVLREENLGTSGGTEETAPVRTRKGSGVSASGRSYSDDALRERQPRLVDLLPTRAWTISVLVLLGLTFIAALAVGHLYSPELASLAGRKNVAAFDLAGPTSVAAWFSSLLFTLAAGTGLLVYSLRRYKVDDYRGRYRAWLPASAALLLLSIDATAGWTQLVAALLVRVSNVPGFGDGAIFRVGLYALLFATVGVRMAIEMRRSRGASLAFIAAAACYGVSMPLWLGVWLPNDAVLGALARCVTALLGHIGIATSVTLYARYVYLDAQGKLAVRKAKAKKAKKPKSAPANETDEEEKPAATKAGGTIRRIDAAHTEAPAPKSPQPAAASSTSAPSRPAGPLAAKMTTAAPASGRFGDPAQTKAAATVSRGASNDDDDDDEDDDDDGNENGRLSKAERKRLKKLQRRGRL